MKRFNGLSQVVLLSEQPKADSGTIKKENLEMKLVRAILCVAVLASASATLLAQTVPGVVTINGGKNTVALHGSSSATNQDAGPDLAPFFSDFQTGADPYNCDSGWTASEAGSPVGSELTPASQFVSARTGATSVITVAVSWVAGANGARVTLDSDCAGVPCGVDSRYLCRGNITHLPTFGSSCTQVEKLKCRTQLARGRKYWVYVEAPMPPNNTWDVWNLANVAVGNVAISTNDLGWALEPPNSPLGAFSVQ